LQEIPDEEEIIGVPNLGNYGEFFGDLPKDTAVDVRV